jgi:glucose-1-phosphate thymidylyltransferase
MVQGWEIEEADDSLIVTTPVDSPQDYGQPVFESWESKRIVGFVEKPTNPTHTRIVTGFYILPDYAFGIIAEQKESARGELEITDTLKTLIPRGIKAVEYTGFWTDCGTPEGLAQASEHFRLISRVTGGG